jgi:hypothetical protein
MEMIASEVQEGTSIPTPDSWSTRPLKIKEISSFETLGNTYPAMHHHIAKDQNPGTHSHENSHVTVT